MHGCNVKGFEYILIEYAKEKKQIVASSYFFMTLSDLKLSSQIYFF